MHSGCWVSLGSWRRGDTHMSGWATLHNCPISIFLSARNTNHTFFKKNKSDFTNYSLGGNINICNIKSWGKVRNDNSGEFWFIFPWLLMWFSHANVHSFAVSVWIFPSVHCQFMPCDYLSLGLSLKKKKKIYIFSDLLHWVLVLSYEIFCCSSQIL